MTYTAVQTGMSTEGPVVRIVTEGAQYLKPADATALALDLIAAAAITRYEAALTEVVVDLEDRSEDDADGLIAAVRSRLDHPPRLPDTEAS